MPIDVQTLAVARKLADGGGGGGTRNYNELDDKPQVNGVTLSGNKSTEDLIPIGDGLEFDNDGKLKAIVTKAVNDLLNYYTKSNVYTKAEIDIIIENAKNAHFVVVAELPSSNIDKNAIYLVPKSTAQTNNYYDEYIYALKSENPEVYDWEKIGDTQIDLSGYVTTSALNTALADYTTTEDLTTLLAGKQNTLTFDSTPTAQSTNPVTSGGIKSYIDEQGAKTVSGNPITITDAEGMNADHVVATITPTQTGSGTPSPSNVRPFTGFSSVEVTVADAPTDPTETKTYTVQLGDTYYGGTLDVTSGKLVINHGFLDIGSLNFDGKEGSENCALFRTAFNSISNPLLGNINYVGTSKCSCFKYDSGTNVTGLTPETINVGYSSSPRVRVATEFYKSMSVAEFKTAMSGQKLCYELATHIEIQLTPTQIELLENNNTITTNVTSLDIKYQANTPIGDTASALDKRVTSLESTQRYSLTEVKTDKVWIDGKPIYQKTFTGTATSTTPSRHYHEIENLSSYNIDKVINSDGFIVEDNALKTLNVADTYSVSVGYDTNTKILSLLIINWPKDSSFDYTFTIRYTKTT